MTKKFLLIFMLFTNTVLCFAQGPHLIIEDTYTLSETESYTRYFSLSEITAGLDPQRYVKSMTATLFVDDVKIPNMVLHYNNNPITNEEYYVYAEVTSGKYNPNSESPGLFYSKNLVYSPISVGHSVPLIEAHPEKARFDCTDNSEEYGIKISCPRNEHHCFVYEFLFSDDLDKFYATWIIINPKILYSKLVVKNYTTSKTSLEEANTVYVNDRSKFVTQGYFDGGNTWNIVSQKYFDGTDVQKAATFNPTTKQLIYWQPGIYTIQFTERDFWWGWHEPLGDGWSKDHPFDKLIGRTLEYNLIVNRCPNDLAAIDKSLKIVDGTASINLESLYTSSSDGEVSFTISSVTADGGKTLTEGDDYYISDGRFYAKEVGLYQISINQSESNFHEASSKVSNISVFIPGLADDFWSVPSYFQHTGGYIENYIPTCPVTFGGDDTYGYTAGSNDDIDFVDDGTDTNPRVFKYYTTGTTAADGDETTIPTTGTYYKFTPENDNYLLTVGIKLEKRCKFWLLDVDTQNGNAITSRKDLGSGLETWNGANGTVSLFTQAGHEYYFFSSDEPLAIYGYQYSANPQGFYSKHGFLVK